MDDKFFAVFVFYPLLLFCLSFHESAHAWMANKLGDNTAKLLGRITLNPIPHMDPIGTVFLPLMSLLTGVSLFGWGKPVPVNPYHFKNSRKGSLWVAAAGPLSNIFLAIIFALALRLLLVWGNHLPPESLTDGSFQFSALTTLIKIFQTGMILNLVLAFFNLIPVFPLDGGSVLRGLLPESLVPAYDSFARYSVLILLLLFVSGLLRYVMIPVSLVANILLP